MQSDRSPVHYHWLHGERTCRWLLLHNSTISVPEVYTQINRPALKNTSLAALAAYTETNYGSRENFVNYITNSAPHKQGNYLKCQLYGCPVKMGALGLSYCKAMQCSAQRFIVLPTCLGLRDMAPEPGCCLQHVQQLWSTGMRSWLTTASWRCCLLAPLPSRHPSMLASPTAPSATPPAALSSPSPP